MKRLSLLSIKAQPHNAGLLLPPQDSRKQLCAPVYEPSPYDTHQIVKLGDAEQAGELSSASCGPSWLLSLDLSMISWSGPLEIIQPCTSEPILYGADGKYHS